MPKYDIPIKTKLERKIEKDAATGCWNWTGVVNNYGYALLSYNLPDGRRTTTTASRLSYETYVGPIPAGAYVCHRCDNPLCVNPDHLFTGTQKQNLDDMIAKGRDNRWGWNGGRTGRQSKFTREQLVAYANDNRLQAVVAAEAGVAVSTVAKWRAKYRGVAA